jgi:hypothetical protein
MLEWWQGIIVIIVAIFWLVGWTLHAVDEYGDSGFVLGPLLAVGYPVYVIAIFVGGVLLGLLASSTRD